MRVFDPLSCNDKDIMSPCSFISKEKNSFLFKVFFIMVTTGTTSTKLFEVVQSSNLK